jgi:hypothetical protein
MPKNAWIAVVVIGRHFCILMDGPGKNTKGKIVLAIWRKHRSEDQRTHFIGFGNINSDAKLAAAMNKTTYPVIVNETGALALEKNYHIVELIKHSVESLNVRGSHNQSHRYANSPALSNLMLTSNNPPPCDPAYRIRVYSLCFEKSPDDG